MTRSCILILMLLACPARGALAQSVAPATAPSIDRLQLAAIANDVAVNALEQQQTARRPTPAPPPPAETPRRRGSMVGYIEDPVVGSKVRFRFDSGRHDPTPDRAEFFYAKCGCYQDLPTTNPAFDPEAPGPRPGAASDVNFQQLYVLGEYATSDQFSVFAELPIRWLQPQSFLPNTGAGFDSTSGISDIRAGAKSAISAKPGQALTAQVKFFFPSGDSAKGLGTNHASIEPAFLIYQELSPKAAIEGQIAALAPFGGSTGLDPNSDGKFSGKVLSYGVGPSFTVYESGRTRFAPIVELVGWHVIDGFETSTGDGTAGANTVNIKFGGRVTWSPIRDGGMGGSVYVGWGKALTDAKWYEDILRFEYRLSF